MISKDVGWIRNRVEEMLEDNYPEKTLQDWYISGGKVYAQGCVMNHCEWSEFGFQFGEIQGWMELGGYYFNSLEGCPEYLDWTEGGNEDFNGVLGIGRSKLKNLIGAPKRCQGGLHFTGSEDFISLEGCPLDVKYLVIEHCPNLKSLKGLEDVVVDGHVSLTHLGISSLEGGPREVGGGYYCCDNPELKSLKGLPRELYRGFRCKDNTQIDYRTEYEIRDEIRERTGYY